MINPRKLAVTALLKIENEKSYSNLTLNSLFASAEATPQEKRLATAVFYGVLDRKITLDYVLSGFLKTKISKTSPFTLAVLRSALYQIMYMDGVPNSAAVNEAVKIMKKSKESYSAGFVNGVLRNILRSEISLPKGDSVADLSIRYSCPIWIIESFIKDYGLENAKGLLEESLKPSPINVRVNTLKTTYEDLLNEFKNLEIPCSRCSIDNGLVIEKGIDIPSCTPYKEGKFHVQDIASQTVVSVLSPKPNDRVLDVCAAPGGKSFTMAQYMENKGEIVACDLYSHRVKLIESGAKRLGINIIKPQVSDSAVYNRDLGEFDCILCDVPCSGLGVLRRKPEIKYKDICEEENLPEVQFKIVTNALKYLKKGGKLLYSTCTLNREENENLVIRLQKEYNNLYKMYEHTFMPHIDGTDGFYCALLEKVE